MRRRGSARLGVVGVIGVRVAHSCAPRVAWGYSGAPRGRRVQSDFRGFTRPRGHWVSRGFTSAPLKVDVLIRVDVGLLGWTSGSFGFACDPSCAPLICRVHFSSRGFTRVGFVVFIRVRVGLHLRSWGSSGSLEFAWVHAGAPRVVGVIGVRVGLLIRA